MLGRWLPLAALSLVVAPRAGAQGTGQAEAETPPPAAVVQGSPMVEREVFAYPGAGRRDPFEPLDAGEELGPRFEDLELSGIIYSAEAGSMVVLVDRATRRRYRVWRGDVIGGAELVAVRPDEAVFVVTVFGVSRQETLRLKQQKEQDG